MIRYINLITVLRIILAPIILLCMFIGNYKISIFLFFLASVSDYLDGYLARKFEAESELGEILDPIADKILVVFLLIGLTIILDSFLIGVLSSFIISREILVTALRDYASRQGYSHKIKVTFLAKIKTSIQLFSIGLYLFALAISFNLLLVICDIFLMIATIITFYTGFEYYINIFKK
jgi:CDP-diacylglycerol--glycerol-3-phosphate 3-phosphatidyltransferase